MPLSGGDRLGPYEILTMLGAGGMGEVYKARDSRLGRHVAIKIALSKTAPGGFGERFEHEARAIAALNHPNICTIHGLEDFDGRPAIVMELVEGETLAARLARGRLPVEESVRIAVEIADALARRIGAAWCIAT